MEPQAHITKREIREWRVKTGGQADSKGAEGAGNETAEEHLKVSSHLVSFWDKSEFALVNLDLCFESFVCLEASKCQLKYLHRYL